MKTHKKKRIGSHTGASDIDVIKIYFKITIVLLFFVVGGFKRQELEYCRKLEL